MAFGFVVARFGLFLRLLAAQQGQGASRGRAAQPPVERRRHRARADRRRLHGAGRGAAPQLRIDAAARGRAALARARSTPSRCASCWRCWASRSRSTSPSSAASAHVRSEPFVRSRPIRRTAALTFADKVGPRPMLQPAHVGHLAMLRSLIRQGAQDGSFDRELGASVAGSGSVLRQAQARPGHRLLRRGRPLRPHRHRGGAGLRVLARRPQLRQPARRVRPLPRHRRRLRAVARGLDLGARGGGHGRALLAALFATPQGQKTWIVRVQRGSRYARPCSICCRLRLQLDRRHAAPALVPAHRRARPISPRAFATPSTRAAR